MSESIEVQCAVCGKHSVKAPARPGTYRVVCPNWRDMKMTWASSATVIEVRDDGSVSSYQGSPN